MPTTIDGLVTGIETSNLIEGLLATSQRRIDLLRQNQDQLESRQTAFKGIEARLLSLQSAVIRLARSQNNVFDLRTVSSSHDDLVAAAASSSAVPGTYSLKVKSLARPHMIASQGFDSEQSLVTLGTLQVRVGSGATATITIDETNNTLQGLATAINNASTDVTATVINDGSDSRTQPYRLLLTSKTAGTENRITLNNSLLADTADARRPVFDQSFIGSAVMGSNFTGSSIPSSNSGSGVYTGASNASYRFTVETGGTVGTSDGIQISYVDDTGVNSGTITLRATDADVLMDVADGLQVRFTAGTLVAGDSFTIDAFVPEVQQAASASITLGSDAGALTITNDSNHLDNVLGGITLDLLGASPEQEIRLTVDNDVDGAREAVLDAVNSYNDVLEFIDDQVRYEPETNRAGILLGERSATSIQDDIRRIMSGVVAGVNRLANRLGAIGITANSQGRLEVNEARLSDALSGRINGVSFRDVRRLFALSGESTIGGVQFVTGGVRTKASTDPYQVDISQAADRATILATSTLSAITTLNSTNNSLSITVDGKASGTITLAEGSYTRLGLAQELESKINGSDALAGRRIHVRLKADALAMTSESFGSASEVTIGSGTALAALGFSGTESDKGQDVVGKFIVNGVDEPAVGTGQFLIGSATNPNTADLQVRVTLSGSQVGDGAEADLTVTRGLASQLDLVLNRLLDPVDGRIKTVNDGFQRRIDDIDQNIERQNVSLESRRQSLLRQFVAMERIVGQLRNTGDFLAAQLVSTINLRQGSQSVKGP